MAEGESWTTRVTLQADDCRMSLEMPADDQDAREVVGTAIDAFARTGALHDSADVVDIRLRYFDRNASTRQSTRSKGSEG